MLSKHKRINNKIAEYLIRGDAIGTEYRKTWGSRHSMSMGIYVYESNRLHKYYPRETQRWRDAEKFSTAFLSAIKDYNIPIWFLKREIKYIAQECVWYKHRDESITRVWYSKEEKEEVFEKLSHGGGNGRFIPISMTLPAHRVHTRHKIVTIDGEKLFKEETYKNYFVDVERTHEMGIVVKDIANYYRNVQHRYYRIYGVECKMCKQNVKHKKTDIICNDLSKYIDDICPTCLKKVCKSLPS